MFAREEHLPVTGDSVISETEFDTLGGRITRAREAAGMSAGDLAQRIGVRKATIRDWESDRSEPRANRMATLAGMLNVALIWLMHGHGEAPAASREESHSRMVSGHLERLKRLHREMECVILQLEADINQFNKRA